MQILLVSFMIFSGMFAVKLPSDFLVCKRSNPQVNKCVKEAIESAFPKLANGIKQLDLPPLEPLTIPIAIIEGGGGPVHVTQKFKNFKINNIVSTKVEKYEGIITPTNYTGIMQMISPKYVIKAYYDFNGRILLLPIIGQGESMITLENIKMDMYLYGELYDKKDKKHLNLTTFDLKLYPGRVIFNFENLFNGNKLLGANMNNVLNENWKEVFEDVKPGYEKVLGTVFKNYARMIFNKVAWYDLYP